MEKVRAIKLMPVTSTAAEEFGYDAETQRFGVKMKGGRIYYYASVAVREAMAMEAAESIGRALNALRKEHSGMRVSGPCPKCGAEGLGGHTCAECGCAEHVVPERKEAGQ